MKKMLQLDSLFSKILRILVDLFLINCLFILFSIPIVTIGASLTAMYTLTLRIVRGEHQYVWRSFITVFKRNVKQATILWMLVCFFSFILYANISFIQYLSGIWHILFFLLITLMGFLLGSILLLLFPTLARFDSSIKNIIFNALKMILMNPIILIILWIISYVPVALILISPLWLVTALYLATFGGVAIYALIQSVFIQYIFRKVEQQSI